jgi:DNA-binding MarR family transcriptional regulator
MIPLQPPSCLPRELIASPAFLLGRLGTALKKQAIEEVEGAGFSLYDYSVMALLAEAPCETQATIADLLNVDRSQLVGLLDGLEQRGLVERRRDPNDRRRHAVILTADGKRQLARLRAVIRRLEDEFLGPLSEDERATLHRLLVKIASHHDARFAQPAEPVAAVS